MSKNKEQNFRNHRRLFPLHHFFITPLSIFCFISSLILPFRLELGVWQIIICLSVGLILLILPVVARIYGLKNQDRIIRLELRQRYYELTGEPLSEKELSLRKSQIIALRFADNDQIVSLINDAIDKNLSAKEIKETVKNWQSDHWRV